MPLIVRQYNYVAGSIIVSSQNNTNENTLYNLVNGNLDETNIASLAESTVTFDTVAGHDHDGSNSKTIDISGPGYLLKCATTGTDHAIIGTSSSTGAHAGINGTASTASALGGYFDHTNSSGTALQVDASGGGKAALLQNASGVAGSHALTVKHRSTTAAIAGIYIDTASSDGYGIHVNGAAGEGLRVTSSVDQTAVHVLNSYSTGGSDPLIYVEQTHASGTLPGIQVDVAGTGVGAKVGAKSSAMKVYNTVDSATNVQIFEIHADGTTGITCDAGGWVTIDGLNITNGIGSPILSVRGKGSVAGNLVEMSQNNTGADGPTGGTSSDEWVLYVANAAGATGNENALLVQGYTRLVGNGSVSGAWDIGGALSKGSGTFKIDHPLHPKEKILRHSFVESPDMKNIYDGRVKLDRTGTAKVTLPDYFSALNSDPQYQLTTIGEGYACVGEEFENGFKIHGTPEVEVCWQVTGIRKDRFALANPVVVEEDKKKPGYLHPEVWQ